MKKVLAVVLGALIASSGAALAEDVKIIGSDTLLILNQEWASDFMAANPGQQVEVIGGGSGNGIKALLAGETDIAASSREMTDEEIEQFKQKHNGREPWRLMVARDGLGIYLHSNNPVTSLTREQLTGIFTGEITDWSEVGGRDGEIAVVTRNPQSGTYGWVRKNIMGGKDFPANAVTVASTSMITSTVARNRRAIGYGGVAYSPGANIIKIAKDAKAQPMWPNSINVMTYDYPLSRPLLYYLNSLTMSEATEDFLRWVLSSRGQSVVERVGYYPLQQMDNQQAYADAIELTPETMAEHGFQITAVIGSDDTLVQQGFSDKVNVLLTIEKPQSQADDRVENATLWIQNNVVAPLQPGRNPQTNAINSISFKLQVGLLSSTSIILEQPVAGGESKLFTIPIGTFNR